MLEHVYLIVLLPFLAAWVIFFFGSRLPMKGAPLSIAAAGWGLLHSLCLLAQAAKHKLVLPYETHFAWFRFDIYDADVGVLIDGTALFMLLVVTTVSFLVQVYSLGYMQGDPRFKRYYSYLSLFTASMLGLVVANNMLFFFICWELVGVCSYLLIGFWFEKPEAAYAGRKAFITTKLGDLGFFLGLLLLFSSTGTLGLTPLKTYVESGYLDSTVAFAAALLILCGAIGKSGQMPLFVWLPDAMEGPTPVSALIHAATMVAAGVYLVARMYFLYSFVPPALEVVAWVGALTAFLAATMALVVNDIKRVLAFSTISQLGYMMLALGVGGYTAGLFHLTTHGFFKALLFLGAGSVIHAVHTNDIREMGGLSRKMPTTFITFMMGTLAIAGIWPFSGFFSKDEIIAHTLEHSLGLGILALVTAGMTSFYMFRLCFLTFFGNPRDTYKFTHAHESPRTMTLPLMVLAVLSLFSGLLLRRGHFFEGLVSFEPWEAMPALLHHGAHLSHFAVAMISSAAAIGGILLAHFMYMSRPELPAAVEKSVPWVKELLVQRYGFDRLYLYLVGLSDGLSRLLFRFDYDFLDQIIVDGFGWFTDALSRIKNWIDQVIVDGLVDGVGWTTQISGRGLRLAQTGLVQNYLLYIALAVSLFAALLM